MATRNSSPKSLALLLLPVMGLGVWAHFVPSLAPRVVQPQVRTPFRPYVAGLQRQNVTARDVANGFDFNTHLIVRAKGAAPPGWGQPINSRSAPNSTVWNLHLERDGRKTRFLPSKAEQWTSGWDDKKKQYFHELNLHTGALPRDAALRLSGHVAVDSPTGKKLTAPLGFDLEIKKAGEDWPRPVVSRDPGASVRSIEIVNINGHSHCARIVVFVPDGKDEIFSNTNFLDAKWRDLSHIETQPGPYKGYEVPFPTSFTSGIRTNWDKPGSTFQSERVKRYEFTWNSIVMAREPRRDIIGVVKFSFDDRWPLEIAFHAKKNGKQPLGKVPRLQRPTSES